MIITNDSRKTEYPMKSLKVSIIKAATKEDIVKRNKRVIKTINHILGSEWLFKLNL